MVMKESGILKDLRMVLFFSNLKVGLIFLLLFFLKALQVQCNAIALLYKESESSGGNIFFYSGTLIVMK